MSAQVKIFKTLSDNYNYLIRDEISGACALIDAGDEETTLKILQQTGWRISDIFITHHHWDHTNALLALKKKFNAKITGPALESDKIKGLDNLVKGGDEVSLGALKFDILDLGGHTLGHIGFFEKGGKHLFSGDCLFSLGCGRMFEGDAKQFWQSIKRIKQLDDESLIYCGHEYSLANAKFALSIDPNNQKLQQRLAEIENQLARGEFTIPTKLKDEKQTNPFLRADSEEMRQLLSMPSAKDYEIFAKLRELKDNF